MNATELATRLATSDAGQVAHKPRRKELKNLTKIQGIWQFKRVVNGKRSRVSLGTRDLALAKTKRDALIKAANGAEIERVLGRSLQPAARMKAIFDAYRTAPTVRANATTREHNIADLVRMVRVVKGPDFDVESMPSDLLTKQLVKEWQTKRLAAAVEASAGDLAALESAKRTLNSLLTHVQSLFSREARDDYGALHLPPNVAEFAASLPVAARRQEEPVQLTDEIVSELLQKVSAMQTDDPGAWAAFQLMTWGGLRNKECLYARESWLERLADAPAYRLTMKAAKDFLPKGNSRAVIIPAAVAEAILAHLPVLDLAPGAPIPDQYLVPGKNYTDRHEAIYRRLNAWLKTHGVVGDAGKIAYRLRKYFLNKVAEQQGLLLAQAAAGHSSQQTLQDHYVGRPKMATPIKLTPLAPPR